MPHGKVIIMNERVNEVCKVIIMNELVNVVCGFVLQFTYFSWKPATNQTEDLIKSIFGQFFCSNS